MCPLPNSCAMIRPWPIAEMINWSPMESRRWHPPQCVACVMPNTKHAISLINSTMASFAITGLEPPGPMSRAEVNLLIACNTRV